MYTRYGQCYGLVSEAVCRVPLVFPAEVVFASGLMLLIDVSSSDCCRAKLMDLASLGDVALHGGYLSDHFL